MSVASSPAQPIGYGIASSGAHFSPEVVQSYQISDEYVGHARAIVRAIKKGPISDAIAHFEALRGVGELQIILAICSNFDGDFQDLDPFHAAGLLAEAFLDDSIQHKREARRQLMYLINLFLEIGSYKSSVMKKGMVTEELLGDTTKANIALAIEKGRESKDPMVKHLAKNCVKPSFLTLQELEIIPLLPDIAGCIGKALSGNPAGALLSAAKVLIEVQKHLNDNDLASYMQISWLSRLVIILGNDEKTAKSEAYQNLKSEVIALLHKTPRIINKDAVQQRHLQIWAEYACSANPDLSQDGIDEIVSHVTNSSHSDDVRLFAFGLLLHLKDLFTDTCPAKASNIQTSVDTILLPTRVVGSITLIKRAQVSKTLAALFIEAQERAAKEAANRQIQLAAHRAKLAESPPEKVIAIAGAAIAEANLARSSSGGSSGSGTRSDPMSTSDHDHSPERTHSGDEMLSSPSSKVSAVAPQPRIVHTPEWFVWKPEHPKKIDALFAAIDADKTLTKLDLTGCHPLDLMKLARELGTRPQITDVAFNYEVNTRSVDKGEVPLEAYEFVRIMNERRTKGSPLTVHAKGELENWDFIQRKKKEFSENNDVYITYQILGILFHCTRDSIASMNFNCGWSHFSRAEQTTDDFFKERDFNAARAFFAQALLITPDHEKALQMDSRAAEELLRFAKTKEEKEELLASATKQNEGCLAINSLNILALEQRNNLEKLKKQK
jgi:hypothetical protein